MSTTDKGISRRNLLKKSAVAGAVFWAVPVIESVTSRAAAQSMPCGTSSGPISISGGAVIFQINGTGTVYWAAFAKGGTTCMASPSVPSDDDFTASDICGTNTLGVNGGSVTWNGSTPTATPTTGVPCYFSGTTQGMQVTAAGVAAGVTVLVWLLHNGTVSPCTPFGSKGHWALGCGSSSPGCGAITSSGCIT